MEHTVSCLGNTSHPLHAGELICRTCGALARGAMLGMYQVQHLLGAGRSGQAYIAMHQRSGQTVVIKLTPPRPAYLHLWEAARREVRITSSFRHTAILPVFSCTTWSPEQQAGLPSSPELLSGPPSSPGITASQDTYLLTLCQYAPGTIASFVAHFSNAEHRLALHERGISMMSLLIRILQQVGSALSMAHKRGIAHGALVPGNLLFGSQEHAWLADFGLARLQPPPTPYLPPELYTTGQASIYANNAIAYWNAVNPLSDQYMFAVLCQQLFSQLLQSHEYTTLHHALQRATQQKPERRYPNIDLFLSDLTSLAGTAIRSQTSSPFLTQNTPAPFLAQRSGVCPTTSPDIATIQNTPAPRTTGAGLMTSTGPITPLTPGKTLGADDWEKRGDKLFTLREYEEALKAYHRALEVHSSKATIWLALGDTYFALERYKEALMAYEQAMYHNPNDPQVWMNRGTALDALGRHREAADCYERSEQLG